MGTRSNAGTPFLERVRRLSVPGVDGCRDWVGSKNTKGYGRIGLGGKLIPVHRAVWEYHNGPVPAGLETDHVCHNRACVNVGHLRVVTHTENVRNRVLKERIHCRHGHELRGDNVFIKARVKRCRTCTRAQALARYKPRLARHLECISCGTGFEAVNGQKFCGVSCRRSYYTRVRGY